MSIEAEVESTPSITLDSLALAYQSKVRGYITSSHLIYSSINTPNKTLSPLDKTYKSKENNE